MATQVSPSMVAAAAATPKPPAASGGNTSNSSGVATLDNAVINLSILRQYGRNALIEVLDSVVGKKGLVLDPQFSGPLGLIAEASLLREHGVGSIYHLLPGTLNTDHKHLIYIVRPRVQYMKIIADHIHDHAYKGEKKEYFVFFVPRRTMICERVLEEEGVYGDITIGEYPLDLIPFDDDVLSLELPQSYKECFLEGDRTALFYVARSLMRLQHVFGIIPNIKGKGACARSVMEMLLRMRRESATEIKVVPAIDTLIIIDRSVDSVTPLCTQLTYEGLVDEIFGIHNSYVDLDPEIVGVQKTNRPKVKTALNSNDRLYAEIRDMNFSVLGPLLNRKAREIDEYYKKRYEAQTVSQIRDFMKGLGSYQQEHQSLRVHTNIAERILTVTKEQDFHSRLEAEQKMLFGLETSEGYIQECIDKQDPLVKVLRLLCLESLIMNGIKQKTLDHLRREIIQAYGYEFLFTLTNLERMGLLKKQGGSSNWKYLRKALRLTVEDINEKEPSDIAYVYSGYAPLSVRLIQAAFNPGWKAMEEVMRTIPGPSFEETQQIPKGVTAQGNEAAQRSKVVLVFFIGGVTFTEISSLRFLGQQSGGKQDFIVATTKLINGDELLTSLFEIPEPRKEA